MKLKTLGTICKRYGRFNISLDITDGRQWLGTSGFLYPLNGLPILTTDNVATMFDVSDKERQKIEITSAHMSTQINVRDIDETEIPLTLNPLSITTSDNTLHLLHSEVTGMIVIHDDFFQPMSDPEELTFYARLNDQGYYVVAKRGFLVEGLALRYLLNSYTLDQLRLAVTWSRCYKPLQEFKNGN